jgi:hypothetical protein
MRSPMDFFALRPFFTFSSLRVVWYIYLLHMAFQLYVSFSEVSQLLAQRGISWLTWAPNSIPLILGIIAQVALVRLLIEVAATILIGRSRPESADN